MGARFLRRLCFTFSMLVFAYILVYVYLHGYVGYVAVRCLPLRKERLAAFHNQTPVRDNVWKYTTFTNETDIRKELKRRLKAASEQKIILVRRGNTEKDYDVEEREECGNCRVTYDRKMINDERTGAVVHPWEYIKSWDMPTPRNPDQLHIFWVMESSAYMKYYEYNLHIAEKFGMNATMSHKIDSAFLTNAGGKGLATLIGRNQSIYREIMKHKSKLAIAVISDCNYMPGARFRLGLIKQLKESGLRIDTFGKCFSNKLGEFYETIPKYKFYFSYENSYHCKYYITEKFFVNALTLNAVPVVWGGTKEDYEAVAPPGSFIFAEEFESPEHLVAYLEKLDKNDDEYLQYFRWRTLKPDVLPQSLRKQGFCAICRAIHGINFDDRYNPRYSESSIPLFSNGIAKRVVPSLHEFFYGEENPECFDVW